MARHCLRFIAFTNLAAPAEQRSPVPPWPGNRNESAATHGLDGGLLAGEHRPAVAKVVVFFAWV
jgi:hypothetical protein